MPLTSSDIAKIRALIREELAVLAAQSLTRPAPAASSSPRPRAVSGPDICLNTHEAISAATGLTSYTIAMIKRASRGEPDSPFTGRITTARRLNRWVASHPQFVPTRVQKARNSPPYPAASQ